MEDCILITDIGKDPDDILALVLATKLYLNNNLNLIGVIANCGNKLITTKRAKIVSGILNEFYMPIPVCSGMGYLTDKNQIGTSANFLVSNRRTKNYLTQAKKIRFDTNVFLEELINNSPNPVSFIVCAGFTDVNNFIYYNSGLVLNKIKNIYIMGNALFLNGKAIPDPMSYNNSIDIVSAKKVYEFANNNGINLHFMPSQSVKLAPINMEFYSELKKENKPILNYLYNIQKRAFKQHYISSLKNKNLVSEKYTLKWFLETFTDIKIIKKYKFNYVWQHTCKLFLYDPFTVLIAQHKIRDNYFSCTEFNNAKFYAPKNSVDTIELIKKIILE